MKLTILLVTITLLSSYATDSYSQAFRLTLNIENSTIKEVLKAIENQSEFRFFYSGEVDVENSASVTVINKNVMETLDEILRGTGIRYEIYGRQIALLAHQETAFPAGVQQTGVITGRVTERTGATLPGVTIVIKGTTTGTITNADGNYSLSNISEYATLVFSFVGMRTLEVVVGNQTSINVEMEVDAIGIEEVVAIGYGTMRKSDLTGSVVRADIEAFRESPNISVMQSLQGSVPGLSVGQVNRSGQEPDILIRGRSSLSGELSPLIVVDGVIFRGNIIDLNPNDIESIDILKDASSAAIYGSQATNGVILITTTKSGGVDGKPTFNYSGYYSFNNPAKEIKPGGPDDFIKKSEESDIFQSRIKETGYLEKNPNWDPTSNFKTSEEINAYNQGRSSDWYDLLTNDNMYIQNHNLSLSNNTKYNNYLISLGFTEQVGSMLNDEYSRLNARINIDNNITTWLKIGIQTFMTVSDYSGQNVGLTSRYISPFATALYENGEIVPTPGGAGINPLLQAEANHLDKRLNFFGNLYANIEIPYIKGLSYRVNFANNYRTVSEYYFRSYESNFQGQGSKTENIGYDWSVDNILSFKRTFDNIHNVNFTYVYGVEKRDNNYTRAISSIFPTHELGYHRLQAGSAELQEALSGAWEEASLYNMGRIFYGFRDKYLLTGTLRRDGFSGFSQQHKFGLFPSISVAWVASEESFIKNNITWLDQFKIRTSYGSVGNRTIGRYQTLARVAGGYNFITASGSPIYTQYISSLASPNLKWETTTGINLGIDFGILSHKFFGSVDYYNNNTKDLLYDVDIPGIGRFQKFPDNLGRLHNHGIEIALTSVNLRKTDFEWLSSLTFSRNRNELKELLGFDLDNDGKEDDLISEGLFIGEPIDAIYTYKVDGKWQVNDDIPSGFDLGSNKVIDLNDDGTIDANDKTIIGYREPSYRFSINNSIQIKNLTLKVFIYSVQGGKNRYLAEDDLRHWSIMNTESHFNFNFPKGIDYWTPENPNAQYQRPNISVSEGIAGITYSQRNFVRLQDISLSYNLPNDLINNIRLQNLKFYLSGKNLLTFTKWRGWDPETGEKITRNGLPVMKSITAGINVEF